MVRTTLRLLVGLAAAFTAALTLGASTGAAAAPPPPNLAGTTFYAPGTRGLSINAANGTAWVTGDYLPEPSSAFAANNPAFVNGAPTWTATADGTTTFQGSTFDGQNFVAVGGNNSLTTDTLGGKEGKTILVAFPTNGPTGPGPFGSSWVAGGPGNLGPFFAYSGVEFFTGASTATENGQTYIYAVGDGQPNSFDAYILAKYRSDGSFVGAATDPNASFNLGLLNGVGSSIGDAIVVQDGAEFISGHTAWVNEGDMSQRPAIRRYDPSLNLVWRTKDSTLNGEFLGLAGTSGALFGVGYKLTPGVSNSQDFLAERYDENGNLVWSHTWGGPANDVLTGAVTVGGRLFAVGYTASNSNGPNDAVLFELDPNTGVILSTTTWGGAGDDRFNGVATDGTGLLVIAESTSFTTDGRDQALALSYTLPGPPAAASNVFAGTGGTGTTVEWTPQGTGGSPVQTATVTSNPGGFSITVPVNPDGSGSVSGWNPPLQIGTAYTFTVTLTNAAGDSPPSAPSNTVVPSTIVEKPSPPIDFGTVPVGVTSVLMPEIVGNTGPGAQLGQAFIDGPNAADFHDVQDSCSNQFLPGNQPSTCRIALTFTPTLNGLETATLHVSSNGPVQDTTAQLVGRGGPPAPYVVYSPQYSVSAFTNFVGFVSQATPAQTLTLTNNGNQDAHITGPVHMDQGNKGFAIASENCSNHTLVANGGSCQISIAFTAPTAGFFQDNIDIPCDASNGCFDGVGGNGVRPPTFALASAGDTTAMVVWQPDDSQTPPGTAFQQTVTANPGGATQSTGGFNGNQALFNGLTDGTAYTFTVTTTIPGVGSQTVTSNQVTPSHIFLQGNSFFGGTPIGYSSPEGQVNLNEFVPQMQTFAASISGPNAGDFAITYPGCSNSTLYSKAGCNMRVAFSPGAVANPCSPSCSDDQQRFALLTLTDNQPGSPRTLVLIGNACLSGPNTGSCPVLSPSPSMLTFGAPAGQNSAPQTATITNTGNAPEDFSADQQVLQPKNGNGGPSPFSVTGGSCPNSVLNPGASCTLIMTMNSPSGSQFGFVGGISLQLRGFAYSTVPAPTNIAIAPGDGVLDVEWDFQGGPDPNLGAIDTYRVTVYSGGNPVTSALIPFGSAHVVAGVNAGTSYTVTVAAHNPAGWSPESAMSGPVTPGPAQIKPLRPYAQVLGGDGLWFVDSLHGWDVTGDGVIAATTDGGVTWHTQPSGTTLDLKAVQFVDLQHGWVAGQNPAQTAAVILRTTDGGNTWTASTPPDATALYGVAFAADGQDGWAVGVNQVFGAGSRPVILGTTDGGKSWSVQMDQFPNGPLTAVTAVDATHAWAVGFGGQFYRTSDGSHWAEVPVGTNAALSSASFVDSLHGWVAGGQTGQFASSGVILATSDGGNSWTPQTLPQISPYCQQPVSSIQGIQFLNQTAGWAVATAQCVPGAAANVIKTADGGATWTVAEPVLQGRFQSLHFLDANHGWIAGGFGVIESTADGGATWSLLNNGGNFLAIAFADSQHGVATGLNGSVYTTADAGQNWTYRPTTVDAKLTGVGYLDAGHVIAVDQGGSVINSSDGGQTWSEQLTPVANQYSLNAIGIVDPMHAFAVGQAGSIEQLSGGTWTSVASPTTKDLNAISVVDATHIWAAGGSTVIFYNGSSWTLLPAVAGASINGVAFTDASHGFAVGGGGAIYATSDAGNSWTLTRTGTNVNLMEVGFADALHGWTAGVGAGLFETIDGGAHWTPRVSGSDDYVLRAVKAVDPGHVYFGASGARVYEWLQTPTTTPTAADFGATSLGQTSSTKSVGLVSAGSGDLRVLSASLSGPNAADFAITSDGCSGASAKSGSSCYIYLTFTPSASGARTATLNLSDDGSGTPQQVTLTGTGTPIQTTTGVTSSANPSVFGQPVTFTATVTPSLAFGTKPTGAVTFSDGATSLGSTSLSGNQASITTAQLSVGPHSITAAYSGDPNYQPSTSGALSQTVNKASTSTALSASANPSLFGGAVTFTATVSAVSPGAGTPTGTVTFSDGNNAIGTGTLSSGKTSFSTALLLGGSHVIMATYNGDGNFNPSPASAPVNESITFTSTVSGSAGAVTVGAGESVLIAPGATVAKVTINAGGALEVSGAQLQGKLIASGAKAIALCGSTVLGAATISGSTGPLTLGNSVDGSSSNACAGNNLAALTLTSNQGQIELDGNTLSGKANVNSNTATIAPEIEANTFGAALTCTGDTPAPTNDGHPNTANGPEIGQCLGL